MSQFQLNPGHQMTQELEQLFRALAAEGMEDWATHLRESTTSVINVARNGHLPKWRDAISRMPDAVSPKWDPTLDAVTFRGQLSDEQRVVLRDCLMAFHPWRKGPFQLCGIDIDAEWRSNLKWDRIAGHIDLADKVVIDVGCGNGYYGWRMLGAGARRVIGLEPYLLYVMQHAAIKRFSPSSPNFVVPASDQQLLPNLRAADVAFSMGVLYHSKNPIGHLEAMFHALRDGGQLVLETLVVEGKDDCVLVPVDRYAKMRNVWFIPSPVFLTRMLHRVGFEDATVVDISPTCPKVEQRATSWMTYESLIDFLDPEDQSRTVEGYSAPRRAMVIAWRRK